jgi:hypothetical protein
MASAAGATSNAASISHNADSMLTTGLAPGEFLLLHDITGDPFIVIAESY